MVRQLKLAAVTLSVVASTAMAVAIGPVPARAEDRPTPWWSGDCDVNNHPGSYPLGTSYNGVNACGPGPGQGGFDHPAYSGDEWECVELVMRYMYLVYAIAPYSADGKDVVNNYSGPKLVKVGNNGTSAPTAGDIVSMGATPSNPSGHTAVVTGMAVGRTGNGSITVMEQNYSAGSNGSRSIPVTNGIVGGGVTGWLHDPGALAWWGPEALATGLSSGPAVSSWSIGRLDVFWVGFDHHLWHKWHDNGWYNPENLGGWLQGAPAAVSWGPGRIDVFARGTDSNNSLMHLFHDGGWSQWEALATGLSAGPGVSSWRSGRLDVFWVGFDHHLWHKWHDNGWFSPQNLQGQLTDSVSAVSWGFLRVDVFGKGTDGNTSLIHMWYG
jgi:CHAP domain